MTTPQTRLQKWFAQNQRDLPWRTPAPRDPYMVVVSEVMLQQTQVATVLRYWERWMREFPTFAALAKAPQSKVLKAWEGMGYYSRARNLQKLAQVVVSEYGGKLPQEVDELLKLPGVGRYSARSIASIAFGKPVACVDGNIVRVLSRLGGIDKAYKNSVDAQKDFQPIADDFLNQKHPGEHNEAMMELGATICTKGTPKCHICPLHEGCWAAKHNAAESLPKFAKRITVAKKVLRLWACDKRGYILLQSEDPATGNLSGIWELPEISQSHITDWDATACLKKTRNITKYKITESIYTTANLAPIKTWARSQKSLQWISPKKLTDIPLSGPHAKWIELLRG